MKKKLSVTLVILSVLVFVVGCGGGGGVGPPSLPEDFSEVFKITNAAYEFYDGKEICSLHARKMYELATLSGFDARRLAIALTPMKDTHSLVEVFIESSQKWVVFDPTFDLYYTVGGVPASAYDMHTALVSGEVDSMGYVKFDAANTRYESYPINGFYLFKNICFVIDNQVAFQYSDPYSEPCRNCPYSLGDHDLLYLPSDKVSIDGNYASFAAETGTATYHFSTIRTSTTFDAASYITSPAYILNDYFKPLFFGDDEYMPEGGFETDTDGDGIADGWTAEGVVSGELTAEDALFGTTAQRLDFGPEGGTFSYSATFEEFLKSPYFLVCGFYKVIQGGVRLDFQPGDHSNREGPLPNLSLNYTAGGWNFVYSAMYSTVENIVSIEAEPNTIILLDGFHLLKNKV